MTTTTTTETLPEGYRRAADGALYREDLIKPIDRARDDLVCELVARARRVSGEIAAFKTQAFADIEAFVDLSIEQYGATRQPGGKKGNVTLLSFNGRYKVLRAMADSITFDERLQGAKALIDECLHDWTSDARPELRALIDRAFEVDRAGNIRTGAILALRRVAIEDERWQRAMQAIADAAQVVASKAYVRVYERIGDSDRWAPIALDVAGV